MVYLSLLPKHPFLAHEKLNKQIVLPDYIGVVRETQTREKQIWRMYIGNVRLLTFTDSLITLSWSFLGVFNHIKINNDIYQRFKGRIEELELR